MGESAIPTTHPLGVGMLGMHGNYGPNVLTNECDVLIAVGMRFDDRVTGRLDKYAKQAQVIHLDIDPAEVDKNVKTTVPVWGDCKETLPLLTKLIKVIIIVVGWPNSENMRLKKKNNVYSQKKS